MKRFIEGENRYQSTLFPESLEDYIAEDNAIRVVDAFVRRCPTRQRQPMAARHDRLAERSPTGSCIVRSLMRREFFANQAPRRWS